jgi:hypothetical protein
MTRYMAARIALGLLAALRAALIYGDGAELSMRPLEWPRRKRTARPGVIQAGLAPSGYGRAGVTSLGPLPTPRPAVGTSLRARSAPTGVSRRNRTLPSRPRS